LCKIARNQGFPHGILSFADTFATTQEARHSADYDPMARYKRPDVLNLINDCEQAIAALKAPPRDDRRAFAIWVLLQKKR